MYTPMHILNKPSRISFPNLCELVLEIFQTYPRSSNRGNYIVEQRNNRVCRKTAEEDQLFFLPSIFSECVVVLENMVFLEKKRRRSLSYRDFGLFSFAMITKTSDRYTQTFLFNRASFNISAYNLCDKNMHPLKLVLISSFQKLEIYHHNIGKFKK